MFPVRFFGSRSLGPLGLALVCGLAACQRAKPVRLEGDEIVVARVNGATITRYDVELQGKHSLRQLSTGSIERAAYPKLVEAAIQSKAIAQAAERELKPIERLALEKEVRAYRDELLVRRYLKQHGPPKPVTREMALDYYQRYPERFCAVKQASYELVGSTRSLASSERILLMRELEKAVDKGSWKEWALELERAGHAVTYSQVAASDRLLHPKLRELLEGLKDAKSSPVAFVQGRAYVARAVGGSQKPPRPFEEVRPEIERLLGPSQVSDAVERAASEVMKGTKVDRVNAPPVASSHPALRKDKKP